MKQQCLRHTPEVGKPGLTHAQCDAGSIFTGNPSGVEATVLENQAEQCSGSGPLEVKIELVCITSQREVVGAGMECCIRFRNMPVHVHQ